ncbi:uncharacterized protein LOC118433607 isoform X2 [Folsomia candida]|uniref:uncharacterized protein LOC118433607 isoform X2 n=1 Tax=Folsomia candida TaxID=158441 RepID=UPI0016055091|nr:uncharacterized protein LOC118433607 isoform X2 [Folsomia candida]
MTKVTPFHSVLFLILIFYTEFPPSLGLADHAAYFIRNAQDDLCITVGPILSSEKVELFKRGLTISSNCTNSHDQQWVITGISDSFGVKRKYKLRSFYSQLLDRDLNAQLRGEFIIYFPTHVQFFSVVKNMTQYYAIYDTGDKKCLQSDGDNHVLHAADCNFQTNPSQRWSFILVNQAHAAGSICSSFWSCNQ